MPRYIAEEVKTIVTKSIVFADNASLALAKLKTAGHGQVNPFETSEETTIEIEIHKEEKQ